MNKTFGRPKYYKTSPVAAMKFLRILILLVLVAFAAADLTGALGGFLGPLTGGAHADEKAPPPKEEAKAPCADC